MELKKVLFPIYICIFLLTYIDARRVKVRPQPIQRVVQSEENSDELSESQEIENDNRPQSAIQYYNTEPRENSPLVSSDEEYNGYYAQPTPPIIRSKLHNSRPAASPIRSSTVAPRSKDNNSSKPPPVQTIRNYNKVNDDGSFTFGYEAADGSFKEETRGTDCVVRGKYGYIDPDGNKREFTYVSGNPCDPNNPEGKESSSSEDNSNENDENSNEPENVPQNYPSQRPVRPVRPIHTTTHAPTTVFQNTYSQHSLQPESEEEEPEPIQVLQPQRPRPIPTVQPLKQNYNSPLPSEVTIRQRPRITINTTPNPPVTVFRNQAVTITPRPTYRPASHALQAQPPATTYRPSVKHQQAAPISYSKSTPRPTGFSSTPNSISTGSQRPVDFNAEFQKFQKEHNLPTTTTARTTTGQYRPQHISHIQQQQNGLPPSSNPIYESQLIYDPASGQYDSSLYQQLPQTDGEYQLNHRIQPYVHQTGNPSPAPQLVSLDQLQQVNPIYRRQPAPVPQFSQQFYEKEKENLQVLNSQQLFQQQQELQNQQLLQDRIEAAKKATQLHQQHRFKPSLQIQLEPEQYQSQIPQQQQQQQPGFYYIQPSGQIDSFLRGHNINF